MLLKIYKNNNNNNEFYNILLIYNFFWCVLNKNWYFTSLNPNPSRQVRIQKKKKT
jgi:hypothetical protein